MVCGSAVVLLAFRLPRFTHLRFYMTKAMPLKFTPGALNGHNRMHSSLPETYGQLTEDRGLNLDLIYFKSEVLVRAYPDGC